MRADSVWTPWAPSAAEPWNIERVAHLHRRAGFGAAWKDLQRDLNDTPERAVDRILSGAGESEAAEFEELATLIGEAAVAADDIARLRAWWVFRCLYAPDSLTERLTVMWHNHFATSNVKVNSVRLMSEQNAILRAGARGRFGKLLSSVVKHPALLIWLDADSNRRRHPNENLARELMELFTLGVGHYSEADVRDAARALTGWGGRESFRSVAAYHDPGPKTILGHMGTLDGDDLLTLLTGHPATARRIAWRLCHEFLGENVAGPAAIESLAEQLVRDDLVIERAVEVILRSRLFFSRQNMASRITGPTEFAAGCLQSLELLTPRPSTFKLAEHISALGQDLFHPPNVFGWKGGRDFVNTRTLLARERFVASLLNGSLHGGTQPQLGDLMASHDIPPQKAEWFLSVLVTGRETSSTSVAAVTADVNEVCRRILMQPDALRG